MPQKKQFSTKLINNDQKWELFGKYGNSVGQIILKRLPWLVFVDLIKAFDN